MISPSRLFATVGFFTAFVFAATHCNNQGDAKVQGSSSASTPSSPGAPNVPAKPRIFVMTPESTQGNIGSSAAADALCMASAAKPSTGTYKALLATTNRRACTNPTCTSAAENLDWVFAANKTYYRVDTTTVVGTTNAAGIFVFPLSASLTDIFEGIYTGLNANWTTGQNCNNWTSSSGAVNGSQGFSDATTTSFISGVIGGCDNGNHLACVEQ